MKVSMLQDNLKNGLNALAKSVSKRNTLPVLENVYIGTEDNRLRLTTTDLDLGISVWIGCSTDSREYIEGAITVPYVKLNRLVDVLSPERVEMETDQATMSMKLTCGATTTTFQCIDAQDYPVLPVIDENADYLGLSVDDLTEAVKAVAFCASSEITRPVLQGISIELDGDELVFVTADGFRMAIKRIKVNKDHFRGDSFKALVSADIMERIIWSLNKFGMIDDIALSINENHLIVQGYAFGAVAYMTEGMFPDYKQIVPKDHLTDAVVDIVSVEKAIKRTSAVVDNEAIDLVVTDQLVTVKAEDAYEHHKIETVIDAATSGPDVVYTVKYSQLSDFLAHIPHSKKYVDRFIFECGTADRPAVVKPADSSENLMYIVMPVHKGR